MRGLTGRNAIVTGGGGAIGRAISLRLGDEGCGVGVFDIDREAAAETAHRIEASGGEASAQTVDVTDYAAAKAALERFRDDAGACDVLVNNAGWDRYGEFVDTEPAHWDRVIAINLTSALNMSHAVVPAMKERGWGRVINMASDAGRAGPPGHAVYSACKGALIAFGKSLAKELAPNGITVNAICPGPNDTPLLEELIPDAGDREALAQSNPMGRLGVPEDIVGLAAFLASEEAAYVTGQAISVSGGRTTHG